LQREDRWGDGKVKNRPKLREPVVKPGEKLNYTLTGKNCNRAWQGVKEDEIVEVKAPIGPIP